MVGEEGRGGGKYAGTLQRFYTKGKRPTLLNTILTEKVHLCRKRFIQKR